MRQSILLVHLMKASTEQWIILLNFSWQISSLVLGLIFSMLWCGQHSSRYIWLVLNRALGCYVPNILFLYFVQFYWHNLHYSHIYHNIFYVKGKVLQHRKDELINSKSFFQIKITFVIYLFVQLAFQITSFDNVEIVDFCMTRYYLQMQWYFGNQIL